MIHLEILEDMGLTASEALVYVTLLENGTSLITELAKKSGLKRTSVTNYIHWLLQKWYISQSTSGKRIVYIAESPEQILRDIEVKKKRFEKHIPELNNLFINNSNKANIRFFEERKWLRQLYREISSQFQEITSFFSPEKYFKVFGLADLNEFIENIVKNDNKITDLIEDSPYARDFMENRSFKGKKVNWLPTTFHMTIDVLIWWDKVALISYDKIMGVIIENKEIADFHRNVHKHLCMMVAKD